MLNVPVTYLTFHRVRFPAPINGHTNSFEGPKSAAHWLFGPDSPQGSDGLRTRISNAWGGAAFYTDREQAEAVLDDPESYLPFVRDAQEAWHALLCPISHRGQTTWFGALEAATNFKPATYDPGGGALVVMTSAGFNSLPPFYSQGDLPRRIDFTKNVDRVRSWYATLPGNLASATFQPTPAGPDGMTFSLWRDDQAMTQAAYQPGIHRSQLDRYKSEHTADRTSFTRARMLRCSGTWDGVTLS